MTPMPGVLIEIVQGEAVAVAGHDAGDHEQHSPQEGEQGDHDVQQDHLAHEGEPVEEGQVLRPLSPADGHAVEHVPAGEDHAHQPRQDGDEGAHQAGAQRAEKAVRQIQHQRQRQIQAGHPSGAHLGAAQHLLHLRLQLPAVDQLCHHILSRPPAFFRVRPGRPAGGV